MRSGRTGPVTTFVLLVAAAQVGIGCQGDPLSRTKHVAGWANASSAVGVFAKARVPLAVADGQERFFDPTCPAVADDGATVVITGADCHDGRGVIHHGSATVVRQGERREVTLTGFGDSEEISAPVTGTLQIEPADAGVQRFVAELHQRGGLDTDIVYEGTVRGGYGEPTVWSGSGTITREALVINSGSVHARTDEERWDSDVCGNQALAGTTTLNSPEHEVVIRYDGADDCDADSTVGWSRDGEDLGELAGVMCSASRVAAQAGSQPGLLWLWLLFALMMRVRRRAATRYTW